MRLNKIFKIIGVLIGFLAFAGCIQLSKLQKVACIGDSITYGHGIEDSINNTYPAHLSEILGENYDVKNFGVCGATCLKKGDLSYWDQPEYKSALTYQPDIVIIMLGTNDSKPQNWIHGKEFDDDYIKLIESFRSLKSKPKIWICNPPPAFETRWDISDSVISTCIIPEVRDIAAQKDLSVIDFNQFFTDKVDLFPDLIHPDSVATELIAKKVAKALQIN